MPLFRVRKFLGRSGKCERCESARGCCELRLDRCWTREAGQRPLLYAHLAAVLALAMPAGFRGDGLISVLAFGPIVATAHFSPSTFGAPGLSCLWTALACS